MVQQQGGQGLAPQSSDQPSRCSHNRKTKMRSFMLKKKKDVEIGYCEQNKNAILKSAPTSIFTEVALLNIYTGYYSMPTFKNDT